jgi:ABC-type transporter MlaC component
VRKLIRAGAVATAAAVLVVAGGGVAAAKTVSNEKYVKTVCKGFLKLEDSNTTLFDGYNAAIDEYNASPSADATAFHTKIVGLVDTFIADLTALQKKLKKVSPEDGGKSVTKKFDAYFQAQLDKLTDAITTFRNADPNGVAYQADVTVLQTALNLLDVGAADPFRDVQDNQDLVDAFDSEKSCDTVVEVTTIGG